jgi:hypothetical protein
MDEADSHVAEWFATDPLHEIGQRFCPPAQRRLYALWGALLEQLERARFDLVEPGVAEAKLGWWLEDLQRGAAGHSRHPLGHAFFAETAKLRAVAPVRWVDLARAALAPRAGDALPVRTGDWLGRDAAWARAVAAIESELFDKPSPPDAVAVSQHLRQWPSSRAPSPGWQWPLQLLARHQACPEDFASQPPAAPARAVARDLAAELLPVLESAKGGPVFRACRSARDVWRLRQWAAGRGDAHFPGRLRQLWQCWRAARAVASPPRA